MDPAAVEQALREALQAGPADVVAAYLFGSVGRGTPHAGSDVDVALLLSRDPPATLEGLPSHVEDVLAERLGLPVQVLVLNTAPVDVAQRVLRDGRLVVDRDPSRRIRFEVRTRNEFFDLEPVLTQYRAARPNR